MSKKETLNRSDLSLYMYRVVRCKKELRNAQHKLIFEMDERKPMVPGMLSFVADNIKDFDLELRRLSSMTHDEFIKIFKDNYAEAYTKVAIESIAGSLYGLHLCISKIGDFETIPTLLAMGFDLFNWINDGLAIDETV